MMTESVAAKDDVKLASRELSESSLHQIPAVLSRDERQRFGNMGIALENFRGSRRDCVRPLDPRQVLAQHRQRAAAIEHIANVCVTQYQSSSPLRSRSCRSAHSRCSGEAQERRSELGRVREPQVPFFSKQLRLDAREARAHVPTNRVRPR